ncbi:MAG: hypothetical protein ACREMY_00860 [bacterium]
MADLAKLGEGLFESIKRISSDAGFEYWRARELERALGYDRWENFEEAIIRAILACSDSGFVTDD